MSTIRNNACSSISTAVIVAAKFEYKPIKLFHIRHLVLWLTASIINPVHLKSNQFRFGCKFVQDFQNTDSMCFFPSIEYMEVIHFTLKEKYD